MKRLAMVMIVGALASLPACMASAKLGWPGSTSSAPSSSSSPPPTTSSPPPTTSSSPPPAAVASSSHPQPSAPPPADDDAARARAADIADAENAAKELIRQLKGARDGRVASALISFEYRDADYVAHRLESLRKHMTDLADIAKHCAAGAGNPELCDLAIHRDQYFTKFLALQFDAILGERLKAWTHTIDRMKAEGQVAVVNYNTASDVSKLSAELGKELGEIGKVLGQTDTQATIQTKLAALHDTFMAAVRDKQATRAWAEHATEARYQDPAVTRAVRGIPGLSMLRAAATNPTWDVIRGALDQPVQRNRYVWALMKKSGDTFCRLYQFTVIEDHMGGGKYGAPRIDAGGLPEFYISACQA